MSWSMSFAAKSKAAATAEIDRRVAEPSIPTQIADILKAQIAMLPEPTEGERAILVESSGHIDMSTGYGYQNADAKSRITILALLALVLALFAMPAQAQSIDPNPITTVTVTPPASGPISTEFGDLALHLNVSVVAFSYDMTTKTYLGQGQIGGLYSLTSARLLDAGIIAGGAITFDSASKPSGDLSAGIVSPRLRLSSGSPLALRGAVLYTRRFGPDAANLVSVAPTLSF